MAAVSDKCEQGAELGLGEARSFQRGSILITKRPPVLPGVGLLWLGGCSGGACPVCCAVAEVPTRATTPTRPGKTLRHRGKPHLSSYNYICPHATMFPLARHCAIMLVPHYTNYTNYIPTIVTVRTIPYNPFLSRCPRLPVYATLLSYCLGC